MPAEALSTGQPVRKSAQRLLRFPDLFANWIKSFAAQTPSRQEDESAKVGFAAGLMVNALIRGKPVELGSKPDTAHPVYVWPEIAFCLNVHGLVPENDVHSAQKISPVVNEVRMRQSFRENVNRVRFLAILRPNIFAFSDPKWTMTELFRSARCNNIAGHFYGKLVQ